MPEEVITLIALALAPAEIGHEKEEYILTIEDLCSLRNVNKRMRDHIQHAFGTRAFRKRRHILTNYSLEGLRDISRHQVFSGYVREIHLGPERIPTSIENIHPSIGPANPLKRRSPDPYANLQNSLTWSVGAIAEEGMSSWAMQEDVDNATIRLHQAEQLKILCKEQYDFDASGQAITMLHEICENLTKLQKICLPSYPRPRDFEQGKTQFFEFGCEWSPPWGLQTLARRMIAALCPISDYSMKLEKSFYEGGSYSNWHLDTIYQAIYTIRDRPDWTIEFDLNSTERYIQPISTASSGSAFVLDSGFWKSSKDRIRQISLFRTIVASDRLERWHVRADWLIELFKSCGTNVETLTCYATTYWAKICSEAPLPKLRYLEVSQSWFQDFYFRKFLIAHKKTLETIKLNTVSLAIDDYDQTNPHSFFLLPREDGSLRDPSWTEMFELMLPHEMPQLRNIEFTDLSWSGTLVDRLRGCNVKKGTTTAAAQDANIKTLLEEAIRINAIERYYYGGVGSIEYRRPCVVLAIEPKHGKVKHEEHKQEDG